MKKTYLIGDCHLSRISEHHDPDKFNYDLIFWGKASKRIYGTFFKQVEKEAELSSGKEEQRFPNDGVIPFSDIKDDGIIFAWLGYVDIRNFLSKYDNADEVAQFYIHQLTSAYPNSTIIIAEPLPQFTEMILKYEGISPSYTYEQRQTQNKKFLESMYKYAHAAGIKYFVTQQEILDRLGVKELERSMTHSKAPHPVDGLQDHYNKEIYNLFIEKIQSVQQEICEHDFIPIVYGYPNEYMIEESKMGNIRLGNCTLHPEYSPTKICKLCNFSLIDHGESEAEK
jgi:hypothetical protein